MSRSLRLLLITVTALLSTAAANNVTDVRSGARVTQAEWDECQLATLLVVFAMDHRRGQTLGGFCRSDDGAPTAFCNRNRHDLVHRPCLKAITNLCGYAADNDAIGGLTEIPRDICDVIGYRVTPVAGSDDSGSEDR